MKKMLMISFILAVLLVDLGYAHGADMQPNLGGFIKTSTKITYKTEVGNPAYGKFVTVNETLENPYLRIIFDSTGSPEKIHLWASDKVIMGCTPELITNSPPRGKGLTFSVQGMAFCTFCPESGVVAKDTCNDPDETYARAYLTLSGTATINNRTDEVVTKLVLKGTAGGGGFKYTPSGSSRWDYAIFASTFNGTLTPVE
jgi:hypothetical protein